MSIFVSLLIPSISYDLILIVSAFVFSDLVANTIVRGGKGIAQIKTTGTTETQPEGYFLIAFFISILVTSLAVNFASQVIASFVVALCSDWGWAIVIAGIVDLGIYGDMRVRFYSH